MKIQIIILLLIFEISCVLAEEKKPAPPPDNGYPYFLTSSVFPLDKDLVEVIVAPIYSYAHDFRDLYLYPSVSYGLTDSWQIYATAIVDDIHWDPIIGQGQGPSAVGFGTEYSWMYINKSTYSAALLFNVIIPIGNVDAGVTDGFIHYEPSLLLAKDFLHDTWRTQFFAQVGFSFVQRVQEPDNINLLMPAAHYFVLSGGVSARAEKINFSVEVTWFTNEWNNNGDDNQLYVTPGLYFYIRKDVAIGIGIPIGLTEDSYQYSIVGNLLVDIDTAPPKDKDDKKNGDQDKPSDRPAIQKHRLYGEEQEKERTTSKKLMEKIPKNTKILRGWR